MPLGAINLHPRGRLSGLRGASMDDDKYSEQVYEVVSAISPPEHLITHAIVVYAYTLSDKGGHGIGFKTTDSPDWLLRGMLLEADSMLVGLTGDASELFEEDDDAEN
jgi:hypothetical protein